MCISHIPNNGTQIVIMTTVHWDGHLNLPANMFDRAMPGVFAYAYIYTHMLTLLVGGLPHNLNDTILLNFHTSVTIGYPKVFHFFLKGLGCLIGSNFSLRMPFCSLAYCGCVLTTARGLFIENKPVTKTLFVLRKVLYQTTDWFPLCGENM